MVEKCEASGPEGKPMDTWLEEDVQVFINSHFLSEICDKIGR